MNRNVSGEAKPTEATTGGMVPSQVTERRERSHRERVRCPTSPTASLGRPAIEALGLAVRVESITKRQTEDVNSKLFQGLGQLRSEYRIQLKEDAKPYALTTPRRIAIPLLSRVKGELQRMESLGVIVPVEDPTDWCSGMVVVPKADGKVRICVDLTKLNESVRRERHPLQAVDQTLAQLAGAKLFTKLDANSGFWQVPLIEWAGRCGVPDR